VATSYKVLGQSNPSATTETTLYTAAGTVGNVVSTIVICNQAATAATYRIAVVKSGGATAPSGAATFIVYGATVNASDTTALTLGITMATGDKIQVYASSATLSFSAFGSELS
jgi:hypothetical protein